MNTLIKKGALALALTLAAHHVMAATDKKDHETCPPAADLFNTLSKVEPSKKNKDYGYGLDSPEFYQHCEYETAQLGKRLGQTLWALPAAERSALYKSLEKMGLCEKDMETVIRIAIARNDANLFDQALAKIDLPSVIVGDLLAYTVTRGSVLYKQPNAHFVDSLLKKGIEDRDKIEALKEAAWRRYAQDAFNTIFASGTFSDEQRGDVFVESISGMRFSYGSYAQLLKSGISEQAKEQALIETMDAPDSRFEDILAAGISEQTRANILQCVQDIGYYVQKSTKALFKERVQTLEKLQNSNTVSAPAP